MEKKIVIITGANSGIGRQTALGLAKDGFYVVLACRNHDKAQVVLNKIIANGGEGEIIPIDLASLKSVRVFADTFLSKHSRLDVLINNAGTVRLKRSVTNDGYESQFQVNYLSHFLLTMLLLKTLLNTPDSRCIILSSLTHKWRPIKFDNLLYHQDFTMRESYGTSKLANLIFAKELTKRLSKFNVDFTMSAVDPGVVSTNIFWDRQSKITHIISLISRPFLTPARWAAKTPIFLASTKEKIPSGNLWKHCKIIDCSVYAKNGKTNTRLFDLSCDLLNIDFNKILQDINR